MLSNTRGNSFADPTTVDLDEIEQLGLMPEDVMGEDEEGLGYVGLEGLGAKHRRRRARRVGRRARRALRRAGRRRRRRAAAARPRRRRRRAAAAATASKPRRRRRRVRRARRGRGVRGLGGVVGRLADTVALQSIGRLGGLGKARRRRRKGARRLRRGGKARAGRRRRRKAAAVRRAGRRRVRRAGRRSLGSVSFGRLTGMVNGMGEAEVKATMPVFGVIEYLGSTAGLEALGGVTLSSFVTGVIEEGLVKRTLKMEAGKPITEIVTALASGIAMWELGRLLGSGNIAKFGAFYAFGRAIEKTIVAPQVVSKIFTGVSGYGLGQARIPDSEELRGYMGQARIPDAEELRGLGQARVPDSEELRDLSQRVVTEEELLGDVAQAEYGTDEESAVF